MKMLTLLLAAGLALALAGPALASIDDYPQLWAGTAMASAATTTEVAATSAPPCPPTCQCPHMTARTQRDTPAEKRADGAAQVAEAKPMTWEDLIPYNY